MSLRRPPPVAQTWVRGALVLGLVLVAIGLVMHAADRPGHYWGDDFTLYLRQADSVFGGPDVGEVIDDNHFMLDASERPDFSPPLYPWGWPLILAVPVAAVGLDVDALAWVSVAMALGFLIAWYGFARDRLVRPLPIAGMVVLGLSPMYVGWSTLLHSELPFMAVTFAALVWLDRCRGRWLTSVPALVALGVFAAASFSVRREGIALLVAIGIAQLADGVWPALRTRDGLARAAIPYAAFAVAVGVLQLTLPSTLLPEYEGTSVWNLFRFREQYLEAFSGVFGRDGQTVGTILVLLALAGIVFRLGVAWRDDAHVAAYLIVAALIGGSFFIPSSRYVSTVVPLLLYFALQVPAAVAVVWRSATGRWVIAVATACVLASVLWTSGRAVQSSVEYAEAVGDEIQAGPQHPDSVDMFAEVVARTDGDDVVGFFKARAMTLATGRRAIQVGEFRSPLTAPVEPDLVVLPRDDRYEDEMRAATDRWHLTWSNPHFLLFTPTPRAN